MTSSNPKDIFCFQSLPRSEEPSTKKNRKKTRKIPKIQGQTSILSGDRLADLSRDRRIMWTRIRDLFPQYQRFKMSQSILRDVIQITNGTLDPTLIALHIQRYGDSKLSTYHWWLCFGLGYYYDELGYPPDAPNIDDYDYIPAWRDHTGDTPQGLIAWVKDRAKWAIEQCQENLIYEYEQFKAGKQVIPVIAHKLTKSRIPLYTETDNPTTFYE